LATNYDLASANALSSLGELYGSCGIAFGRFHFSELKIGDYVSGRGSEVHVVSPARKVDTGNGGQECNNGQDYYQLNDGETATMVVMIGICH
jgi:hypothetical protein